MGKKFGWEMNERHLSDFLYETTECCGIYAFEVG